MTSRTADLSRTWLSRLSPAASVIALAALACAQPQAAPASAPAPAPPAPAGAETFEFTTSEKFDARSVAPYQGNHAEVYAYIDAHREEHLEHLRRWVRQQSISAQNVGIGDMAAMVRDDFLKLGFKEAELVPTSGHPGVWGYYDAGAAKTLVIYMMYDVQPIEPEGWSVAAFEGAVVNHPLGRVLMARGATNQKGPQRAFLNALQAIIATRGRLPVNLMVVAEGEEELGSPNFPEVIARYENRLRTANGVFFPFNSQGPNGDVGMSLGVKGLVYFELESTGGSWGGPASAEIHGSYKSITDSPVWRLTQALATLTSPDGNTIRVPGYYDAIRPPNEEEQRLVNGMLESWTAREGAMRQGFGVSRWIDGLSGRASLMRHLFTTTLNIDGIWGGYTGPGVKTILPHRATAKLDSRLVPNQTPDEALRLIRAHLDAHGFGDVVLRKLSGYPPAQSSVSAPLVQAAIGAYNKHGFVPSVAPRLAGSAPYYIFTEHLGLPIVMGGLGHGSGQHAPNEYMVVEPREGSRIAALPTIEKFYVDLLYALSETR
ncbi:MAG TPA: M20/M25/M40 family metallo-hydrolase [Gemmatimonadaceae bacterium]